MLDFKEKMKIKKYRNSLFFVILALLIIGSSAGLSYLSMQDDHLLQSRNKSMIRIQKQREDSLDALVVGDSLSYSAISPMKMWEEKGIASYVCGQSGQKLQETYSMLEIAFKTQHPKVVVMETGPLFRVRGKSEEIKSTLSEMGNRYFPIFRYHDVWKTLLFGKKYAEQDFEGYLVRGTKIPYTHGDTYMSKAKTLEEIKPSIDLYMQKIIALCEQNDAKLLLVSAPSPHNYNTARCNAIAAYARENDIAYLNLNDTANPVGIDWSKDCLDKGDHLNVSGAERVSIYLAAYLKENYDLPDHRGEEAYASYTQMEKQYDRIVNEKIKEIRE